jgi:O-antigen/teichoic acid export membrane protein
MVRSHGERDGGDDRLLLRQRACERRESDTRVPPAAPPREITSLQSLPLSIETRSHFQRTADGTIWTFLAEALILPSGLITAAYLTRKLGPDGYGLFSLAATLITVIGGTAVLLFSRGTIKLIAEAADWRPVATTVLRMHAACGLITMLLVIVLARPLAAVLEEPRLTHYLVLFALDPLLLVLSRAHRSVLIGAGRFREQAVPLALRQVARLLLIVVLVESGLSIAGAVLGLVGASAVELIAYRRYVRPRIFPASGYPARRVWNEATPIFFSALFLALFGRVDLFALTALGLPTSVAGYYGAAQNLSIVPGLFAMSFTPLLLSTLSRMRTNGEHEAVRAMCRDAMRLVLGMLPFAAMASAASDDIVRLIFGPDFAPTAPLLACLIFGKVAAVMISITVVMLIVVERPMFSVLLAAPMLALAIAGHLAFIPRFGSIGAAYVTAGLETAGALVALALANRFTRVAPPGSTVVRTLLITAAAWLAASTWPAAGVWLVAKLALIAFGIVAAYALLGEFRPNEVAWVRAFVYRIRSRAL